MTSPTQTLDSTNDNFDPESMLSENSNAEDVDQVQTEVDLFCRIKIVYVPAKTSEEQDAERIRREAHERAYIHMYTSHNSFHLRDKVPQYEYTDPSTEVYVVDVLGMQVSKHAKVFTVPTSVLTPTMLVRFQHPKSQMKIYCEDGTFLCCGRVESFVYSKEKHSVPSIELHLS